MVQTSFEHIPRQLQISQDTKAGRQEVADVFADFYCKLYTSTQVWREGVPEAEENVAPIPLFDIKELHEEARKLRRGRARDGAVIGAEMI